MIEKIIHGNNIEVLKTFPDNYFDSVVTDPPYGIAFMGKKWDYDVASVKTWKEVFRVLKPGGHMLVACGTRTQHRMAVNIEDAGFEIRDIVAWVYGSGFPKSHDISKAIDKSMGAEREVVGKTKGAGSVGKNKSGNQTFVAKNKYEDGSYDLTKPSTDLAKKYEGWGTALKPAMELWTMARKPIEESTIAENVIKYGTGGINIDECRVETFEGELTPRNNKTGQNGIFNSSGGYVEPNVNGRFPANFIHDGSEEVENLFPLENEGSPSRFFYVAKASQEERNFGLSFMESKTITDGRKKSIDNAFNRGETERKNIHPTVKPIELMRYLVRMITPPNGICLDHYLGSGTTAIACEMEKFNYIGIERDEQYVEIAKARVSAVKDYETHLDTKTAIKESIKEDKEKELGIQNIFDFM